MDGTLLKGLRVLETLARSEQPCGITELAKNLDLTKSNVHRTLQTLIAANYVQMAAPGRYSCTFKLFELACVMITRVNVRQAAEPFMKRLLDETGESVHLSVLDQDEVIYLNKLDSPQPVRAYSSIGGRAPAYCVASGKALLAHAGEAALMALGPYPLPAHTRRTITDLDELRKEMQNVRNQGFAVNRGEWRESVCGLASIVLDAEGLPSVSIGISGPAERLRPTILRRHQELIVEVARGLSKVLGHNSHAQHTISASRRPRKQSYLTGDTP